MEDCTIIEICYFLMSSVQKYYQSEVSYNEIIDNIRKEYNTLLYLKNYNAQFNRIISALQIQNPKIFGTNINQLEITLHPKFINKYKKMDNCPILLKFDSIDNVDINGRWIRIYNKDNKYILPLPRTLYFINNISVMIDIDESFDVRQYKINPITTLVLSLYNANIYDNNKICSETDRIINISGIKTENK